MVHSYDRVWTGILISGRTQYVLYAGLIFIEAFDSKVGVKMQGRKKIVIPKIFDSPTNRLLIRRISIVII
jgi:hypothetical protein